MVAGPRAARRRPPPGNEADRRGRAGRWRSRCAATSSSITARAAGTASPSRANAVPGPVVTNFGDGPVRNSGSGASVSLAEEDFDPFDEARMVAAVTGGIRFVSLYAPNGRVVESPFYAGKLGVVRAAAAMARRVGFARRTTRHRRRLQHRPHRSRRLGRGRGPRRHARLAAGTGRVPDAPRLGPRRHLPRAARRARPLHVVGLPRRHVPQELRDADRPPADDAACRRASASRPTSTARRARGSRCRPTTRRCSWTSTSPACRSTPAGPAPRRSSRRARRRINARRRGRRPASRAEPRGSPTRAGPSCGVIGVPPPPSGTWGIATAPLRRLQFARWQWLHRRKVAARIPASSL